MQAVRKERMVNIELLRILSMFMVVSLHYLDKGHFLPPLPHEFLGTYYLPWTLEALSIGAVNIYVLIAGYFMVDTEFKLSRVVKLWLQVLFYAMLIPAVLIVTGALSVQGLTIYDVLQYVFPINMEHYWFATEYLFLLLLSPILNKGVKALSQKQLQQMLAVLLFATSIIPSILPVKLTYDKDGYNLLWFITLYVTAAYIKLYGFSFFQKKGKRKAAVGFLMATAGIFGWMCALNFIAMRTGRLTEKVTMSFHYNHILVWAAAVFAFYLFLQLKVPGRILGKIVNWAAQGTFGIYLLHEHFLVRYKWVDRMPWEARLHCHASDAGYMVFHIGAYLASILAVMVAGIFIDFIRRKLFDFIKKLAVACRKDEAEWEPKEHPVLAKYIFPAILLLLPLWNVWSGIDVVDTGYSLSYYRFFPELDGMWFFSTFLANLTGWLLNLLPGGHTLLGMNIYTSLFIGATAVAVYFVLSKKISPVIAFVGEVLAVFLCWCPTVILYHYMTYIFFTAGALLLCLGICKEKNAYLFAAGTVLGINAFVRTPSNFLEVGLIVVLWYVGWLRKEKMREILRKTGICIAGYLASAAVILLILGLVFGFGHYFDAIMQMMNSAESASDYTLKSMLITVAKNLLEGFLWLLKLGIFFVAGIVVQFIGKKKWIYGKSILCVLLGLGGLYLLMRQGFFDRNYQYHLAVFNPFLVFVWLTVFAALWQLISKKAETWEKVWAMTVLVMTVLMPFGTNNHLYANMNNLFLVAPFFLYVAVKFWRLAISKRNPVLLSAGSILAAYLIVFLIQSAGYGMNFVLMDGYDQEKRDTRTEGIASLVGMYTNAQNAEELTNVHDRLVKLGLEDAELITFGNLPGLYFYLDMPCSISVLWPDLNTSSAQEFAEELQAVTDRIAQGEEPPVVIITYEIGNRIWGNRTKDKERSLHDFLIENGYHSEFLGNNYYELLIK